MIIIADSGSTKTEWRLISKDKLLASTSTVGLNPLAYDKDTTIAVLQASSVAEWIKSGINEVHFYSAGIIDEDLEKIAAENLKHFFKEGEISVNSDLLGAARAVFGTRSGVIGILGTGSNTGYYDGSIITNHIPALGYILADEGSGSVMGRILIKHFLRNELPEKITASFKEFYPEYQSLIKTIYSERHAAKFLASFVPFLYEHREQGFIKELVLSELNKFIKLINKYPGKNVVGIVGSVGYQFQSEIKLLAANSELNLRDFVKSPIEKLINYHQSIA